MYLIMPDRFSEGDPSNDQLPQVSGHSRSQQSHAYHGGDLRGIENHLDYIQKLGATTLWITPLYAQDSSLARIMTDTSRSICTR